MLMSQLGVELAKLRNSRAYSELIDAGAILVINVWRLCSLVDNITLKVLIE